ncbi:microtubule-associated protein 1B-like [Halyomorpha halys]|uniref:microtubule-associated protein 1B-like n=1 Tax=Halyomorpha halys TaxID=286706 RepID=UPI0034D32C0B
MVGTVMRRQALEAQPPIFYSQPRLQEAAPRGWNKYGTMSGGSALSKSMKYAESWLYGSLVLKQPDWQSASLFGTVRARARPRARLPEDPYDLVRQSRLGRAKSTSPPRQRKSILECQVNPYDLMDRVPNKVSLAGQTIRMQESSDEEWSSSETLIPRLTPRRPPRKKEDKPEIKSILKKPEAKKKPDKRSSFRDYKHKKKKQVQFRDAELKKKEGKEQKGKKEEIRKPEIKPEIRIEPKEEPPKYDPVESGEPIHFLLYS